MSITPHPATTAIRTLALVGQTAAGKTCLTEALLWKSGAIGAPGSLERGATVSDFDPLERKVQHSLTSALVHMQHQETRIHLIDTPGYPDFLGQSMTALEAVETAAIVVNATSGIEMMSTRMMEWARHARALPHDHRQQDRRRRASTCRRWSRRSRPPSGANACR